MFNTNDKLTLTLLNARDINGNILPFHLKLPLNNQNITIPKDLVSIEIHEYYEGQVIYSNSPYKICIGNTTTLSKLIPNIETSPIKINNYLKIKSLEDTIICYQEINKTKRIYATINNQDIIVKNQKELIEIIKILSNEFNNLKKNISNIKKLTLKYK